MNPILDKLTKLAIIPKTRFEKLHSWFKKNEKKYISIGLAVNLFSGFILFPVTQKIFVPLSHVINAFDYFFIYLLSAMPAMIIWMMGGSILSPKPNQEHKLAKKQKAMLFNYLQTSHENQELKEILIKIKLISLINQFNSFNDATHKIQFFIDNLKKENLDEEDFMNLMNIITNETLFTHISTESLFNQHINELKEILAKKIAFKLQQDKEKLNQYDSLIDTIVGSKDDSILFKQAKTLSANL